MAVAVSEISFDPAEIEKAFGSKPAGCAKVAVAKEYISLLDNMRAQNAGIALARLGIPVRYTFLDLTLPAWASR